MNEVRIKNCAIMNVKVIIINDFFAILSEKKAIIKKKWR